MANTTAARAHTIDAILAAEDQVTADARYLTAHQYVIEMHHAPTTAQLRHYLRTGRGVIYSFWAQETARRTVYGTR